MEIAKKLSDIPEMNDEDLAKYWDNNEPENFEGLQESDIKFARPPKKLIQLRLDPRDIRVREKFIEMKLNAFKTEKAFISF